MPHRRRTLFAGIGVLWGICTAGSGCYHLGLSDYPDSDAAVAPAETTKRPVAETGAPTQRTHPPTTVAVAGWQEAAPADYPAAGAPSVPVPGSADWRAAPPSNDGRGKTVIASNWRPTDRGSVSPAQATTVGQPSLSPLVAAEFPGTPAAAIVPPVMTAPQLPPVPKLDDKKADEKPPEKLSEKPAEKLPEQLAAPTVIPGPDVPPAPPGVPLLGLPVAGHSPSEPAPRELCKVSLPPYVIEPPDVLLIESTQELIKDQPLRGQHLVRPDGTVSLGIYGTAHVAGMTLEQAKEAIGHVMSQRISDFTLKNLNVDVLAYNSKFYYVITDGGGYGEQVYRLPIYGSETVLDAIAQINGLPAVASKRHIWVARRQPGHGVGQLPVDWIGITQHGSTETNYQVMPGDRIYVRAEKLIRIDTTLAKIISPIERVFGVVLLGSSTVNSIKNPNSNNTVR